MSIGHVIVGAILYFWWVTGSIVAAFALLVLCAVLGIGYGSVRGYSR